MTAWTDNKVAALVEHVEAGLTAQQVANALGGFSRCAVIGKVRRTHGLQLGVAPGNPGVLRVRPSSLPDVVYVEPDVFRQPVPLTARPWLQREDGQCAFPVAGEGEGTLFCCAPAGRKGYCEGHAVVLYGKARRAA